MILCGKCLHNRDAHEKHNGKFMYCASCMSLCDIDEFEIIHKPTSLQKIIEISAKK